MVGTVADAVIGQFLQPAGPTICQLGDLCRSLHLQTLARLRPDHSILLPQPGRGAEQHPVSCRGQHQTGHSGPQGSQ